MSAKTSGDEKLRRLNELFSNAGITDVKEGVQYIVMLVRIKEATDILRQMRFTVPIIS